MEQEQFDEVLEAIGELSDKLDALSSVVNNKTSSNIICDSGELNELYSALAKAQGEFQIAGLNKTNPYYSKRYADFSEIVTSSRPALTKNGLSVIQQIRTNPDGQSILHTRLGHSSGQWIETQMRISPPKNDIQSLGSYLESLKRYSYTSLVGIVASGEDDDGEVSMVNARQLLAKGPSTKYNPKEQSSDVISRDQMQEIEYELGEYLDIAEEIMDSFKIQSLADLPKNKFPSVIRRIREIIQLREGTAGK